MLSETLTVRGYELDRHGRVASPTWLRWFEHARWSATSGASPIDLGALFDEGKRIVVRAQRLEILDGALAHGDAVELEMWIQRVGRTSFDFGHLARRARDGAVLARAAVVAVHLSAELRPLEVPERIRAALEDGPSPKASLLPPSRPAAALRLPLHVRPSDIDLLQHVNHAVYAEYFEDARVEAREAGAFEPRRRAANPTRAIGIEYVREAKYGDGLAIYAWFVPNEPTSFGFELVREGDAAPIARARIDVTET